MNTRSSVGAALALATLFAASCGGGEGAAGSGGGSTGTSTSSQGSGGHPCTPGSQGCVGNTRATCNDAGEWEPHDACPMDLPVCAAGACTGALSCLGDKPGAGNNCGPSGDESCCASQLIPGGTFNRIQSAKFPATVSDFRMDRFLLTVGRFRAFLAGYPANKPAPGAGAHSKIAGSGWDPAWDANLPETAADLAALVSGCTYVSFTPEAGANENKILNCTNWYLAFAFCAWDGGRLPTEAEWNYAAAGGSEQRYHPWGAADPDSSYAVYNCIADGSAGQDCAVTDIAFVGSRSPKGDSKWGVADQVGGAWEWMLDSDADLVVPCADCANLPTGPQRSLRGGSWSGDENRLNTVFRNHYPADGPKYSIGGRCARNL